MFEGKPLMIRLDRQERLPNAPITQWPECQHDSLEVAGSSPAGRTIRKPTRIGGPGVRTCNPVGESSNRWTHGAIAHLGERLHGMQKVAGSNPASSTGRYASE